MVETDSLERGNIWGGGIDGEFSERNLQEFIEIVFLDSHEYIVVLCKNNSQDWVIYEKNSLKMINLVFFSKKSD